MRKPNPTVVTNPWQALRQFTAARIALGRSGVSLPTAVQLDFQLAHARARDAVHLALDTDALAQALISALTATSGGDITSRSSTASSCITLSSAAESRTIYLQRPDLGRRLDAASRAVLSVLKNQAQQHQAAARYDLAIVIADGLSALAITQNAQPFLAALMLRLAPENWCLAPLTIVRQGRVAIGDEVAELLGAKLVVVLIGERPGLSSPDSMGLYLTWEPRVGLTDASRNCISNVRPAGLSYEEAAFKLHYLLTQARTRQLSGVQLKDETATGGETLYLPKRNFLLEEP